MAEEINPIEDPRFVSSHDVHLDTTYADWIAEIKHRYRSAQVKAAVRVNAEKLLFNWQLGRDLVQKKAEERWGTGVVEQVSLDLREAFPQDKGFSSLNLWYMKRWYLFYNQSEKKLYQPGKEINDEKLYQLGREIGEGKMRQSGAEFPESFALVPWRNHVEIISKCKTELTLVAPDKETRDSIPHNERSKNAKIDIEEYEYRGYISGGKWFALWARPA